MGAHDLLKPWRNLQAECALAGLRAVLTEDDRGAPELIVSKWNLTRSFSSVAEATEWLQRVTGHRVP